MMWLTAQQSFLLILVVTVSLTLTHGFAVVSYRAPLRSLARIDGRASASRPNQRFCTFPPTSIPLGPVFATSDDDSTSESSTDDSSVGDTDSSVEDTTSASDAPDDGSAKLTFRERISKLWWKNDDSSLTTRQRLQKLGVAAVLSYGWVSNVSYAICVSLAWFGFSKKVCRNETVECFH